MWYLVEDDRDPSGRWRRAAFVKVAEDESESLSGIAKQLIRTNLLIFENGHALSKPNQIRWFDCRNEDEIVLNTLKKFERERSQDALSAGG